MSVSNIDGLWKCNNCGTLYTRHEYATECHCYPEGHKGWIEVTRDTLEALDMVDEELDQHVSNEERVMELINGRLEIGRKRYGGLKLRDGRDKLTEALEEALDLAVYLAGELLELKENKE